MKAERCDYLRPSVIHCESPEQALAKKEYLFPFFSVVRCPQAKMLSSIGGTLVATAITEDRMFRHRLLDATHIYRLNLGPVPTLQLYWLQSHEGSIIDFMFRARAFQEADSK